MSLEFLRTEVGLEQMAYAILAPGEDTCVILEATGHYQKRCKRKSYIQCVKSTGCLCQKLCQFHYAAKEWQHKATHYNLYTAAACRKGVADCFAIRDDTLQSAIQCLSCAVLSKHLPHRASSCAFTTPA